MKTIYKRTLNLTLNFKKNSFFLFGPRSTGKSFLIKQSMPSVKVINLLDNDVYNMLLRHPNSLQELVPTDCTEVVIDEIQKIPVLLDIVHKMIEERSTRFLLTGSSARKLKREGVNLLGGRAWEFSLFPLTSHELQEDFDLLRYFNHGGIPRMYLSSDLQQDLKAYAQLYLTEEIKQEALVRKFDQFVHFLDTIALNNGEELHYSNISNDCGVSARTLESYIDVLKDTLTGFHVYPFLKTKKRKAITRSKFYLFDLGVTNFLANRGEIKKGSELFGKALEHFIALELRAYLAYNNKREELCYWRTKNGFEVDFVVGNKLGIEIKSTGRVSHSELKGLKALAEEKLVERFIVVCMEPVKREVDGITIYPLMEFLSVLWSDEFF